MSSPCRRADPKRNAAASVEGARHFELGRKVGRVFDPPLEHSTRERAGQRPALLSASSGGRRSFFTYYVKLGRRRRHASVVFARAGSHVIREMAPRTASRKRRRTSAGRRTLRAKATREAGKSQRRGAWKKGPGQRRVFHSCSWGREHERRCRTPTGNQIPSAREIGRWIKCVYGVSRCPVKTRVASLRGNTPQAKLRADGKGTAPFLPAPKWVHWTPILWQKNQTHRKSN